MDIFFLGEERALAAVFDTSGWLDLVGVAVGLSS